MEEKRRVIRVGSRKSQLALIQTHSVIDLLMKAYPETQFEVETIATTGDKILDKALSKIGEKSLFTKELERALEAKQVDFVVHSLKDLPTVLPPGMVIGAVIERDNPRDAVVFHPKYEGYSLETLPKDSVIGTSSLRRIAQLKRSYPHLKFHDVRGNLNTRLRKLDEADTYAALVLAVAGLKRMGWDNRIGQELKSSECMYAVSQGAKAVECREDDQSILNMLSTVHDRSTSLQCIAERAFLKTLEGGCSVPIGADCSLVDDKLTLTGGVYSLDGQKAVEKTLHVTLPVKDSEPSAKKFARDPSDHYAYIVCSSLSHDALQAAEKLGQDLAKLMITHGASEILREARKETDEAIQKMKTPLAECPRSPSRKTAEQSV